MTENQNFERFKEVVHNFGKTDLDIIYCKILISTRCKHGFVPNLLKESITVPILDHGSF